ncbi:MAG: tRNA (N(6)-L-threonylcarbamoyladenosine(37)-C(2))-methylthiotransferase MtaB [bacterium]|nr:tRNA (N(6)-L-threonylcarbamoyladenosine(37)-C(2))-methylthiotransferase MtaB [bacterium]
MENKTPPLSDSTSKVVTFGCRLNTYESEVIKGHLKTLKATDTIVVNTCAVTSEAERQGRQTIRKLRRDNPNAHLVVTGCSAQVDPKTYESMSEVDQVLGNVEKMEVDSFRLEDDTPRVKVQDIMEVKETAHHLISGFEGRARAFVEVQNGCNHRCTFCTIPFGRGNNRSVPMGDIAQQVQNLATQGCQEIVFTGVDITDYGKDLPGQPTLGQMTRRILNNVPDLPRLRLSSIDPVEIDDHLLQLIETEPRLMPHFHLSLQAGDDLTLKRMKRRHLSKDAIDLCAYIRRIRPDVVFGADIIAGFPTETEEMFQNTLETVKACDLTYLHVFPYSIRKGTPAARMPQVIKSIIKERAARLRSLGDQQLEKFLNSRVEKEVSVLIEQDNQGHCEHYTKVRFKTSEALKPGSLVKGRILSYDLVEKALIATPLPNKGTCP